MSDLLLCTTITRDAEPFDVVIRFRCMRFSPGCPADLWGPAPHPAYPPEGEFEITSIEFDPCEPDESGPLTDEEREELTQWFHSPAGYELAMERYAEEGPDEPDWDAINDARRDERMEWAE